MSVQRKMRRVIGQVLEGGEPSAGVGRIDRVSTYAENLELRIGVIGAAEAAAVVNSAAQRAKKKATH